MPAPKSIAELRRAVPAELFTVPPTTSVPPAMAMVPEKALPVLSMTSVPAPALVSVVAPDKTPDMVIVPPVAILKVCCFAM